MNTKENLNSNEDNSLVMGREFSFDHMFEGLMKYRRNLECEKKRVAEDFLL